MKKIKKIGAGGEIYSNSSADRLSSNYGIDISDQLSAILSAEISKSIDAEILQTLGVLSTPERRKRSLSKIFKK